MAELRSVRRGSDDAERDRLLGKMLREARDIDVRAFVAPMEVAAAHAAAGSARIVLDLPHRRWRRDGLL